MFSMAKIKKTQAPKKRNTTASDDTNDSGLNLSTQEMDDLFSKTDEEGTKEDKKLSLVQQAAMKTTYLYISVSVVTREVGAEGAEAVGALFLTLLLTLTMMSSPSSDYSIF